LASSQTKRGKYHHGNLRQAILDAAIQLIAEQGINSLTLREVAQRVGVSPMASYRHFENKSMLLVALAEDGFNRLHNAMNLALDEASTGPLRRLQATGVAYVLFAVTHPSYFRVMFGASIPDRCDYPELHETASKTFDVLVRALVECQQANCIRSNHLEELAQILWAQVHGLAMLILDDQLPEMDLAAVKNLAQAATWTTIEGLKL
jgi:AcrR family transcriptional regulator